MMLSVSKVTFTLVFLNIFVMALVSLPTYVNLTHLFFSLYVCKLSWCSMPLGSMCRNYCCLGFVVLCCVLFACCEVQPGMRPFNCTSI